MGGACCAAEAAGTQNERLEEVGKLDGKKSRDASTIGAPRVEIKTEDSRKKQYAKKDPILLGYWKIRGLAQPIRYLLEYTEHPY